MLQKALCLLVFVCFSVISYGQTPAYTYSDGPNTQVGGHNIQHFKVQCIYTSKQFPTMPAGRVKAIYFRTPRDYTIVNQNGAPLCYFPNLSMKMGYSADTMFKTNALDSFRTNLVTLYGPDTFRVPCSGPKGTWIKIPVTKGNFQYNPKEPFIVEIAIWPKVVGTSSYPGMTSTYYPGSYRTSMYAFDHTATTTYNGGNSSMDLGIDLGAPSEIVDQGNVTAVGLFPNPATDGRFTLSLEAKAAIRQVGVTVSTPTGHQIMTKTFSNVNTSFFEELGIGSVAPGLYFVRIEADGDVITRRLVIQ